MAQARRDGVAYRCFGSGVFWLVALILVPVACAALQLSIKIVHLEWFPDVNDIGRELDKGYKDGTTPTSGDAYVAGFSLAGLFDCRRAEAQVSHGVEIIASMARGARHSSSTQVSHKDLAATISGMDSPGRLGVQDSTRPRRPGDTTTITPPRNPSTRRRRRRRMVVLLRRRRARVTLKYILRVHNKDPSSC